MQAQNIAPKSSHSAIEHSDASSQHELYEKGHKPNVKRSNNLNAALQLQNPDGLSRSGECSTGRCSANKNDILPSAMASPVFANPVHPVIALQFEALSWREMLL